MPALNLYIMLKKIIFLLLLSSITFKGISQTTFSWSGYTNAGYAPYTYTTGIMSAVVTPTVPGSAACSQSVGASAGTKFFCDPTVNGTWPYSPRYITASGSGDYNETGLLLAVDWPDKTSSVTTNITFSQPVIGPITFRIFDINTDGGSYPFSDVVVVSGVNCAGSTVYPTVSGVVANNSYNAATGTMASTTPTSSGGNAMSDVNYTFAAGVGLNSLQIIYKSNSTITNTGSGCAGNNNGGDPYYEYIVISNITAYPITTSISASAMPCGSTTTTLTATTNMTLPTYAWSGTAGTTIVSPTSASTSVTGAGTYTVTVTGDGGCTSTASYTVTPGGTAPTITATPANPTICSGSSVTLTAGGGVTYAWAPAGGLSATTGMTVTANPTTTTSYIVTGTDGTGCTNTANVTVNVNPIPTANAGNDQTICAGQSATLTASGGGTYQWSNAASTATTTVTPASTATFTVTVTSGGCSASDAVIVNVNPLPLANAGPDQNICTGQSATLTATGGGTYQWSNAATTATTMVTPATTATFTVTVTNNGCSATDNVIVNVGSSIPANAGPDQTICTGQSATLTATGGGTYLWSNAASTATTVVTPATTATFTVTVTSGGCSATDDVIVNINPLPIAFAGNDQTICASQSATLTATGGGTYVWSSGGNAASITVIPGNTTTYTVTVTTGGCSATDDVIVNVNPQPLANAGPDQNICTAQSATLTATGGGTYQWSNAATTASTVVTPAATSTFTVTVTNNGCSATDDIIVNVGSSIPANAGTDQNICTGQSATLTATGGTTYSWSNSATTATTVVTPAVTSSYTVTVSSGGCSGVDTVIINVGNNAVILVTPANPSICSGSNVLLTASGGNTYSWSPAAGLSDTTGTSVTASPTTTTTYTINGSNGTGCTGSTTVTVTVAPLVATATSTNENCGLANGTATVSGSGTCTSGFSYLWDTPTQQTLQSVSNLAAGTYNVTVSCGACVATASVNITNTPGLSVSVTSVVNEECSLGNGSATATVTGGTAPYQYNWSSNPAQNTAVLTNVSAGTYTVTAIDANGCSNVAIATLGLTAGPAIAITSSNENCSQNNGSLSASASNGSGNYTYAWSTNPTQTTQSITNLAAGTYTVTVNDGTCTSTASVTINNIEAPVAGIDASPHEVSSLNSNVNFSSVSSGNIVGWLWNYGDGSSGSGSTAVHNYSQPGTYIVTLFVTDNNGCTSMATDTIIVYDIFTVYIPSAFTPTGDGLNDFFFPVCTGIDPSDFQFLIFNRWGNLVFESTTYGDKWNGTKFNQGNPTTDCINAVYVYRISVKPYAARKQTYIGRVTLVN